MLKKQYAKNGTVAEWKTGEYKDVMGTVVDAFSFFIEPKENPHIPKEDMPEKFSTELSGAHIKPIPGDTITVLDIPRKKGVANVIKVKLDRYNVVGYMYWIDVYKNTNMVTEGI